MKSLVRIKNRFPRKILDEFLTSFADHFINCLRDCSIELIKSNGFRGGFQGAIIPGNDLFLTFLLQGKGGSDISASSNISFIDLQENREEKAKVCFGSGLERKTLEADKKGLVSKHARCNIIEVIENVGPTTYDFAERKSAVSDLMNKPTSKRGTILGGRTARRKTIFETDVVTPGPGAYNIPTTFDKVCKQSCAPFNSGLDRWKHKYPDVPGVGIYNVALYKRRRIAFAHTFGGKKCLFPAVKMKCGPFNFDTCERCQKFPEGDYWYLDIVEAENLSDAMKQKLSDTEGIFLCRPCYEIEKKENKIFSKGQIRVFKKIRDCSKVHFHDGCKAKLFLVSPQEIEKVKLREGYLSLYFS